MHAGKEMHGVAWELWVPLCHHGPANHSPPLHSIAPAAHWHFYLRRAHVVLLGVSSIQFRT
jgi:hypothetical protein